MPVSSMIKQIPDEPTAGARTTPADTGTPDNILANLDQIVACTHWGNAPLLSREQTNDRRQQISPPVEVPAIPTPVGKTSFDTV